MKIRVNGEEVSVNVDPKKPLLWVLREDLTLNGTKYGCGKGFCGACTVHIDDTPVRSCMYPVSQAEDRDVTTIEGLGSSDSLHVLQREWVREQVPQCGYCQSGQLMSAVALLKSNPMPSRNEIRSAMNGNLCRCGTYGRIEKAILNTSQSSDPSEVSIDE